MRWTVIAILLPLAACGGREHAHGKPTAVATIGMSPPAPADDALLAKYRTREITAITSGELLDPIADQYKATLGGDARATLRDAVVVHPLPEPQNSATIWELEIDVALPDAAAALSICQTIVEAVTTTRDDSVVTPCAAPHT